MTEIPKRRTKAEFFPIKNVLEKSKVATHEFTTLFQVILNASFFRSHPPPLIFRGDFAKSILTQIVS
jgi:hypothetical protein